MTTRTMPMTTPLPDMAPERDFDRLAQIAASICKAPIAFVSIIDDADMWFKARMGFDFHRVPRQMTFCDQVGMRSEQIVVPNLLEDERTCHNPLIEAQGVRFYAGHPILDDDGGLVGTVCVLDHVPRPEGLTPAEQFGLSALADQAASFVRMRTKATEAGDALRIQSIVQDVDRRRIARLSALVRLGDKLRDATSDVEAFGLAGEALGVALNAQQAGYVDLDNLAGVAVVVNDWRSDGQPSMDGRYAVSDHQNVLDELRAGSPVMATAPVPGREGTYSHLRAPVMVHGRLAGFIYVIDTPGRRWSHNDVEFAHGVGDRMHAAVDRLRLEADRDVVVAEVGHRLKNVMAVTRAIAMQTLAGRADQDITEILDERLSAYAGAHDMLLAGSGDAADLHATIHATLERLAIADRVALDGPSVELNERATMTVSLLMNELATNALKHGALSCPTGRVQVDWTSNEECTTLVWREKGGPEVVVPTRKGFGSRILAMGLDRVGGTKLDYAQTGLEALFTASTVAITPKVRGTISSAHSS